MSDTFIWEGSFDTVLTMLQPKVEGQSALTASTPPDPTIAAGPDRLMVLTNSQMALYSKTGTLLGLRSLNGKKGFWGTRVKPEVSNKNTLDFVADPWAVYDLHENRFVVTCIRIDRRGDPPWKGYVLLAVSQTSAPEDLTEKSWYFYQFDRTQHPHTFPDYAKLGYDSRAYYISEDNFPLGGGGGPTNHQVFAISKLSILWGGEPELHDALIVSTEGTFLFPCEMYDGGSSSMFCVQSVSTSTVTLWAIPSFEAGSGIKIEVSIPLPSIEGGVRAIPQPDDKRPLDSLGRRFMTGLVRNNHLWSAHAVNQEGVVDPVTLLKKTTLKWYEFDLGTWPTLGTPSLVQFQTIPVPGRDALWMPHLQVDTVGNMAIGGSICSLIRNPSIAVVGRRAEDAEGTTRDVEVVRTGNNSYDPGFPSGSRNRWGDYSGLALDPDGVTFWLFHEYPAFDSELPKILGGTTTGDTWRTAVFRFRFSPASEKDEKSLES